MDKWKTNEFLADKLQELSLSLRHGKGAMSLPQTIDADLVRDAARALRNSERRKSTS